MFHREAGMEARRVSRETGAVTQAGDGMAWGQDMGGKLADSRHFRDRRPGLGFKSSCLFNHTGKMSLRDRLGRALVGARSPVGPGSLLSHLGWKM